MFRASLILLGLLATLGTPPADAQTAPTAATTTTGPQRDAQAVTLANQAYQALAGRTQLQDATLEATATWVAGSDEETGSARLEAKGSQESRIVLNLSGGEYVLKLDAAGSSSVITAPLSVALAIGNNFGATTVAALSN